MFSAMCKTSSVSDYYKGYEFCQPCRQIQRLFKLFLWADEVYENISFLSFRHTTALSTIFIFIFHHKKDTIEADDLEYIDTRSTPSFNLRIASRSESLQHLMPSQDIIAYAHSKNLVCTIANEPARR